MKVRARHWLKYDGTWYRGGDVFEVATTDTNSLNGMVDIAENAISPETETEKPKRGRPKKTTEN